MAKIEVSEALEKLKLALATFKSSDDYKAYLRNQARFHRYSPRNMALILWQKPDATHVAGFTAWQRMGRSVKKGEKGLSILSPIPFTKTDGDKVKSGMFFKLTAVFDVSQTEAVKENAFDPSDLDTEVKGETDLLDTVKAVVEKQGVPVTFVDYVKGHPNAGGVYYPQSNRIEIKQSNTAAMAAVLIHEWAHLTQNENRKDYTYDQEEVIVESIAFIVSQVLGIQDEAETSSFHYITSWLRDDEKKFTKALGVIQKEAKAMIELIEKGVK